MDRTVRLHADVSERVAREIHDAVASGDYASESEVVGAALGDWAIARRQEPISEADLKASLKRAAEGPWTDAEVVFDRLIAKYETLAETAERKA